MLNDRFKRLLTRLQLRLLGLGGTERFIPRIQTDVPWAAMHFERYRFASRFVRPTDTVTDLACGVGYGTDVLSEACASAVGMDRSSAAIRYARKHYKGSFRVADLFTVNAQTDVVVSFETVEHIPAPLEKTITHLLSVSKRTLVASVPYLEPAGNNPFHYHDSLKEDHFLFLNKYGTVRFFYQEPEPGFLIHDTKIQKPQNLILVVQKDERS